MILRRREKQTLDALEDLAMFLRDVREERKAVITITDGWRLVYAEPESIARPLDDAAPPMTGVNVDPRNGRLTTKDTPNTTGSIRASCEADRCTLSELNDEQRIRTIFDEAEPCERLVLSDRSARPRSCSTSQSCRPPGSASAASPNPTLSLRVDNAACFGAQQPSLRGCWPRPPTGSPSSAANDIEKGFKRITDDMSSYYLLEVLLDREARRAVPFDSRPRQTSGVEVRARRGYLAPSAADAWPARPTPKAATPARQARRRLSEPPRPRLVACCPAPSATSRCACR